ncbi:MAG: hypothetical protein U9N59_10300 [Campylobacterota bacterium]|nr:hypothetical protein [Campylobacterota bacterium]
MTNDSFDLEVTKYKKYKNLIVLTTILLFSIAYLLEHNIIYGILIIIAGTLSNIILKNRYKDILRDISKKENK